MVTFDTPLDPVASTAAKVLARHFDLHTVGDLMRYYPRRYAERGELTDLSQLRVGELVTVMAEVRRVTSRRMKSRRGTILEVLVGDGRRNLTLIFFNQAWREKELVVGRRGLFAGKVTAFQRGRQLAHPEYVWLDPEAGSGAVEGFVDAPVPIYPLAGGVRPWVVANAVKLVLDQLDPLPDPLPPELRKRHGLAGLNRALHDIHTPPTWPAVRAAQQRLKWDEALVLQVTLAQRRRQQAADPATPRRPRDGGLRDAFDARLPFELTGGQREVGEQIAADLARAHPMHRLLQGEVGSGKTVVALRAMLQVIDAGGQAALLAPTEVLAAQHARSLRDLLGPLGRAGELDFTADDPGPAGTAAGGGAAAEAAATGAAAAGAAASGGPAAEGAADGGAGAAGGAADAAGGDATRVALLTGSLPAAARRRAMAEAASGEAGIVVGTHALIQDRVEFADLGLVVVDEQHRFGVEQRDALRAKGNRPPHVLVMTATPIPRTVAMTVYGDLEAASLRELPKGRAPVSTTVVPASERPNWLERAWQRIREEVERGHQAFVVCPRIGDEASADDVSADDGSTVEDEPAAAPAGGDPGWPEDEPRRPHRPPLAVADVLPMLVDGPLAGLRVDALHGRLPPEDKDAVMGRFAAGDLDVLVATTVIEVGVDVPNATVMVVLDADRFGVSQLHQLRGRIGRGTATGLCLLVTDAPEGTKARERLAAVASTADGFALARLDLEQRREGDVLGSAQWGRQKQVRLLSLLQDEKLIVQAREEAAALVEVDPDLRTHPALAAEVAALTEDRAEYLEKA
jgi:ATP-dependent DNA helicase RecG